MSVMFNSLLTTSYLNDVTVCPHHRVTTPFRGLQVPIAQLLNGLLPDLGDTSSQHARKGLVNCL